jgi:hypothetical protein
MYDMELHEIQANIKRVNEDISLLKEHIKDAEDDIVSLNEEYGPALGNTQLVDIILKYIIRYDTEIQFKQEEIMDLEKKERDLEVNLAAFAIVAEVGVEWGKNNIGQKVTDIINKRLNRFESLENIKKDMLDTIKAKKALKKTS